MDPQELTTFIDHFMEQEKTSTREWLLGQMDDLLGSFFNGFKSRLVEAITVKNTAVLRELENARITEEEEQHLADVNAHLQVTMNVMEETAAPKIKAEIFENSSSVFDHHRQQQNHFGDTTTSNGHNTINGQGHGHGPNQTEDDEEEIYNGHVDELDSDCDCSDCQNLGLLGVKLGEDEDILEEEVYSNTRHYNSNHSTNMMSSSYSNQIPSAPAPAVQLQARQRSVKSQLATKKRSNAKATSAAVGGHRRRKLPASKRVQCPAPGCDRAFNRNFELKIHYRSHLGIKPFRCRYPNCDYQSEQRTNTYTHIRLRHFNLPVKRTHDSIEYRDQVLQYLEVVDELLV